MEEKQKPLKMKLSTFITIIAIGVVIMLAIFMFIQKKNSEDRIKELQNESAKLQETVTELQGKLDSISNIASTMDETKPDDNKEKNVSTNNNTSNNNSTVSNNYTDNQTKNVKYEFVSVDRAAMQGHAIVLKIYNLTENELDFSYDSAIDFETDVLDREVKGIARTNANKQYEFEENVSGHIYKIVFNFSDDMDEVKVTEYDNGKESGWINLLSNM